MVADVEAWRAGRDDAAVDGRARRAAPRRGRRRQHDAAVDRPGQGRRHDRRVGRPCCARCSASTAPRPASAAAVGRRAASWPPWPSACKAMPGGPPKLLVAKPGLDGHSQRRRADRRRRPRRRHGGRLLRHPPHARADRRVGPRRGPRRHRPVDPVRLAPRAGARRRRPGCATMGVDAPVVVGGIIPEEDRAAAARRRRRRASTRRRTSTSRGSWARSPISRRSAQGSMSRGLSAVRHIERLAYH